MQTLLLLAVVGFAAQLVDGALGMAFGVITNTLMVGLLGVPPALASQRVHLVECFTTATSGISHLLHGNIDRALFFRLLVPGVIECQSNYIEHPDLIAQRIGRYAHLVGRENVMAGVDCGLSDAIRLQARRHREINCTRTPKDRSWQPKISWPAAAN